MAKGHTHTGLERLRDSMLNGLHAVTEGGAISLPQRSIHKHISRLQAVNLAMVSSKKSAIQNAVSPTGAWHFDTQSELSPFVSPTRTDSLN